MVHRDLKPGNILVTADGTPKLLDFGIAKLLDPAAQPFVTRGGIQPLTPEYASPEQMQGEPVGTFSDVYSLGVLLHVLLSGELPATGRKTTTGNEARTAPTTPPGTGGGRSGRKTIKVRGELGNIVAKAMHDEPARRYASAGQLAEDVRRYLTGFPVMAKPDSVRYRTGKFVRRYPWQVAAAAAVLGLILASTATATVLFRRAERERDRAEAVSDLLVGLIEGADPSRSQGGSLRVVELLGPARAQIENASDLTPDVRAALLDSLAWVYRGLGRFSDAASLSGKALEIREEVFGPDHPLVAESLHNHATMLRRQGNDTKAEPLMRRAVEIQKQRLPVDDPDYARGLNNLAALLESKNELVEAEALYREALTIKERIYSGDHEDVAVGLNNLAKLLQLKGDLDAAEPLYRRALAMRRNLAHGKDDPDLARVINNLATLLDARDKHAEAEPFHREALQMRRRLYPEEDHEEVVRSLNNLAWSIAATKPEEAESLLREAFEISADVEMKRSERILLQRNLGKILLLAGKPAEAEPHLRQARESIPPDRWQYAHATSLLGACLDRLGRRSEAEPLLREGVERFASASLKTLEAHRAADEAQARWEKFQGKAPDAVPASQP